MQSEKKKTSIVSKIVDVIIWLFVIFAVVMTIMVFSMQSNTDGIPSLFGKSLVTIKSASMQDAIKTGDLIIVKTVDANEAKNLVEGDVITFHSSQDIDGDGYTGDIETHRIVKREVLENGTVRFTTQGDNRDMCPLPDPPINSSEVIGVWTNTRLAGVGRFIAFLSGQTGFFFLVVLPMILFFLYGLINFILVLMKNREKPVAAEGLSAAEEEAIKKKAIEEYLRKQAEEQAAAQNNDNEQKPEDGPGSES